MPLACIERTIFDYDAYIKACDTLNMQWLVWQPDPAIDALRFDRCVPNNADLPIMMALNAWANRVDPGAIMRSDGMKLSWLKKNQFVAMDTPCVL